MIVQKVCPCLTRQRGGVQQLLLFRHPLAGLQLLKGTVEEGESPESAALRELQEESGIHDAQISRKLGEIHFSAYSQNWHLFLIEPAGALPDSWHFFTEDDSGLRFEFFWQDIVEPIDTPWPDLFDRARYEIQQRI